MCKVIYTLSLSFSMMQTFYILAKYQDQILQIFGADSIIDPDRYGFEIRLDYDVFVDTIHKNLPDASNFFGDIIPIDPDPIDLDPMLVDIPDGDF